MKIKEYSIQTKNFEEHFEDQKEAQEFWNSLTKKEKQNGQFFSKVWKKTEDNWIEKEVIILN
jgi:hypothetical protein